MNAIDQIAAEYAALTTSAGLIRREAPGLLALGGDDAAEFLQGQVTNDIEALKPGEGHYAALLTPKGKMRADMRVLRTEGTLLVLTDAALLPVVRHTIDTFRIGYFFTTEDRSESTALISLIGPDADGLLTSIGATELGEHENANVAMDLGGESLFAVRSRVCVDLIGTEATIEKAADLLIEKGALQVSEAVGEIVRVERGVPAFGNELDENTIPGEAGLNERAVNFEKGCYVGQETVARMHYKGKPNRMLRGLKAEEPLSSGAAITASDGRELGNLGTAVESPAHGSLGLSVLRREAEPGDVVDVGGVSATVLDIDSFPN
jgi:folate-binding protein YgfZ